VPIYFILDVLSVAVSNRLLFYGLQDRLRGLNNYSYTGVVI